MNSMRLWLRILLSAAVVLLPGGVAAAAIRRGTGLGLPPDASLDGHRIDWLIQITGVFVIILFVIMCIWMFWACRAHNEKHKAEYDHGDSRKHITVALSLSALIFFVVDGNLFVNSVIDLTQAFWNYDKAEKHPKAVRIEINAHQWAWDVRYPGPDGKFNTKDDIVTLNEVHVPVNTPVILQLASVDVIHSFSLPNFRVKMDAVPGSINRMWFQAKEKGDFAIACQEHCGTNHYLMKGVLKVLSEEDYAKWAKRMSSYGDRTYDAKDTRAHWGWPWKKL